MKIEQPFVTSQNGKVNKSGEDKQCGQKGGIFPFCGIFGPKGGTDF